MKAVQIKKYSKDIIAEVYDIPKPNISDSEVLIKVKAAAVNHVDVLIMTGSLKLIQDYPMPLTLGNECSGVIEKVGENVKGFKEGEAVYTRLPINKIGAFAEYVAVDYKAISKMPEGYDFVTSAGIPLASLTAYQGIIEELNAKAGETILITGGSGSFGQMAAPIAKELGLNVIVSGNEKSREKFLNMGIERYIDYRSENYWDVLSEVDHVIDTLGEKEFEHELSVLKKGGILLSLRGMPNKEFAERNNFSLLKRKMFSVAGGKFDKMAEKQGKKYKFMFVRSDGEQLKKITEIVEKNNIVPEIDDNIFSIDQSNEAIKYLLNSSTKGKVIIEL